MGFLVRRLTINAFVRRLSVCACAVTIVDFGTVETSPRGEARVRGPEATIRERGPTGASMGAAADLLHPIARTTIDRH